MRITVLCGGPGDERSISLVSGQSVADALRNVGHEVFVSDILPEDLSALDHPADVVFPVLHGQFGESGELQAEMERRGLAFVGSGSHASRLGINKSASKKRWADAGLFTPQSLQVDASNAHAVDAFPLPCIVKPVDSGSSVGVHRCTTRAEARDAVRRTIADRGTALVERFIAGAELTIGFLEERALPPIRILTKHEFFDFNAKYEDDSTQHVFDTRLPEATLAQCVKDSTRAYHLLGCRDLARVDLIVDDAGIPWLLEINTIPGFTSHSLLPRAAAHAGITFEQVVDRLAQQALRRAEAMRRLSKAV